MSVSLSLVMVFGSGALPAGVAVSAAAFASSTEAGIKKVVGIYLVKMAFKNFGKRAGKVALDYLIAKAKDPASKQIILS